MTWAAVAVGGGALAGGALSFLGGQSQAKAGRAAAERYIDYLNQQRNTFLNQKETSAIRDRLGSFIGGNVGYSPEILSQMKQGVYEDYGKGLADLSRISASAGVMPGAGGNIYQPGTQARTTRMLGENIAANRARSIRDINIRNADVGLANERFAVGALPTYMPGLPATQAPGADVFQAAGQVAPWGSYMGPAVSQGISSGVGAYQQGQIYDAMQKYYGQLNTAPSIPNNPAYSFNYASYGA